MPLFGDANDFEMCPTGNHVFRVSGLDQTAKWKSGVNAGKPAFGWEFSTVEVTDEQGYPFKVKKMTGTNYTPGGNGFLNQFIDNLFPDLSVAERKALEEEDIVNKTFTAVVYHQTTDRGQFATFEFETVRPLEVPVKQERKAKSSVVRPEKPSPVSAGNPFNFDDFTDD